MKRRLNIRKLHIALHQALSDLREVENMPIQYEVQMSTWHMPAPTNEHACKVCLAGATMARRMNISPREVADPGCFSDATERMLVSLDKLRTLRVTDALNIIGTKLSPALLNDLSDRLVEQGLGPGRVIPYEKNRYRFIEQMEKLVSLLKEFNL